MPIEKCECFFSAVDCSRQSKSAFFSQQGCKPGAHDRVIVHYQDSYRILFTMLFHATIASIFPFALFATTTRRAETAASFHALSRTFHALANFEYESSRRCCRPGASYRECQILLFHPVERNHPRRPER